MKTIIFTTLILTLLLSRACSPANIDYIKEHADARWTEMQYEVVTYEGYQWCRILWNTYGGACVWYALKRDGIMYSGFLKRWGDEIHVYNLKAVNAIVINQ